MKTEILIGALALSLSSCALFDIKSLKPHNLVKTTATTAVTYTVAGPIPALANLLTSVTVDEVLPEESSISQIEEGNKEQMTAYIAENITTTILYAIIGFLVFTNVIGPWAAQRRARRKAEAAAEDRRRRDKYDAMKAELKARRSQD
jgi:hypothetical protein